MRAALVAAVALAGLVVAPAATAKELQAVVLCGSSGCVRVDDPETLREVPQGGETEEPLAKPSPFFRVTFIHGEPPNTSRVPMYYLPRQNALAYVDRYGTVRALTIFGPSATNAMRRLTRGLVPFRPPRIVEVRVGDRVLRGLAAAAYTELFHAGTPTSVRYPDTWLPVDLRSTTPSPWTEGAREFMLAPGAGILERGGIQFELDAGLAADVSAARPLGGSRGGIALRRVGFGAAAVLVPAFAGLALLWRRRRLASRRSLVATA